MALTNPARLSEDVRLRIYREGAVPHMESLIFEKHELISRITRLSMANLSILSCTLPGTDMNQVIGTVALILPELSDLPRIFAI